MDQERQENKNFPLWIFAEDRGIKPIFSKVVGCNFTDVDNLLRCGMNFGSNTVFTQNLNLVNLRLASVNTTNKLGSFSILTTRVRRLSSSSNWIRHGHDIEESTVEIVSKTKANSDYISNFYLENMREIQYFERGNDPLPLTRPTKFPEKNEKGGRTR